MMSDGWDKQTVVDLIGALRTVPGRLWVARNEVGNIALLNPDDGAFVGFVNLRTSEVELTMPESYDGEQAKVLAWLANRKKLGTLCSVCDTDQFDSPSGPTCANGHGGAEPKSARAIQQPTAAQLAGAPLDLETAKAMLAKMTVYAEQVEHQLKAAQKGLQDLAEMVGPRDAGYDDVWSSVELLKKERDAYKKAKAENDERFMLERDIAREEANQLLKQLKDFGKEALRLMKLFPPGSDDSRALSALVATALSTREYRAEHPKLCRAESTYGEPVTCTREPGHEGKHSAPIKVLTW
jgi:hypothetical protein